MQQQMQQSVNIGIVGILTSLGTGIMFIHKAYCRKHKKQNNHFPGNGKPGPFKQNPDQPPLFLFRFLLISTEIPC